MQLKCQPVTTEDDLKSCMDIRRRVFIEERHVPASLERDDKDAEARHFVTFMDGQPVATCRVRLIGSAAKIERMAVVKEHRGHGIGLVFMRYVLQELAGLDNIQLYKLSAQSDAVPFYEKLGFRKRGNEYMDAGIPHYDMILEKLREAKNG